MKTDLINNILITIKEDLRTKDIEHEVGYLGTKECFLDRDKYCKTYLFKVFNLKEKLKNDYIVDLLRSLQDSFDIRSRDEKITENSCILYLQKGKKYRKDNSK